MQSFLQQTPPWVLAFTVGVVVAFGALALAVAYDALAPKPRATYDLDGVSVELWAGSGRSLASADVVVAPVSPDLKMETGVAKLVRDATGGMAQAEADRVAPLAPGEAFLTAGSGGRMGRPVLAVVMDAQKRHRPEWIRAALRQAFERARAQDAYSVLIPDMTADLVRQPETLPESERAEVCRLAARAVVEAIEDSPARVGLVRIWPGSPESETIWREELERRAHAEARLAPAVG